MPVILIYTTCPEGEAEKIAGALLDQKLVACANIMPAHTALYDWDGRREKTRETTIVMKTRAALFERARAAICALHSYDCPCIVALPVIDGHAPFLEWVEAQAPAQFK